MIERPETFFAGLNLLPVKKRLVGRLAVNTSARNPDDTLSLKLTEQYHRRKPLPEMRSNQLLDELGLRAEGKLVVLSSGDVDLTFSLISAEQTTIDRVVFDTSDLSRFGIQALDKPATEWVNAPKIEGCEVHLVFQNKDRMTERGCPRESGKSIFITHFSTS